MSTKGKELSTATRYKIAKSKTKHTKTSLAKAWQTYATELQENPKQLPTISGFCLVAGISRSHLLELAHDIPEVSDILDHIKLLQEDAALQGGITNKLNPVFSMFLLKSHHGYQEQPKQLTQNNNFNITPELLKDAVELMKEE